MTVHVGVPSIGCSDRLGPLVCGLLEETDATVTVYCNRPGDMGWDRVMRQLRKVPVELTSLDRFHLRLPYGRGIYTVWNQIMDEAQALGVPAVILNDDIKIDPFSLGLAEFNLTKLAPRVGIVGWDPNVPVRSSWDTVARDVTGTYREQGVTGFAFAVDPSLGVRCDERFGWWGGDDDLVWSVLKAGYRAVRMVDVGVEHGAGGASSSVVPEVLASIEADEALLFKRWGKSWLR